MKGKYIEKIIILDTALKRLAISIVKQLDPKVNES